MNSLYDKYFNDVPNDIELILKSISNPVRFKICLILLKKNSLSFRYLFKEMGLQKSAFYHHIKKIEIAGLIQNYIENNPTTREHSYYEITELGRLFIRNLNLKYNSVFKTPQEEFRKTMEIPEELLNILSALSNRKRMALSLYLKGIKDASFTELLNFCKCKKSILTSYIKRLVLNGVIENYYRKTESNNYSYYKITKLGAEFIDVIIDSYNSYYNISKVSLKDKNTKEDNEKNSDNQYTLSA